MLGTIVGSVLGGAAGAGVWFYARTRNDACFMANYKEGNDPQQNLTTIEQVSGRCAEQHPIAKFVDNVPFQWMGMGVVGLLVGGVIGHFVSK